MGMRRTLVAIVSGITAVAMVPVAAASADPQPPFIPQNSDWLTVVNYHRAMAGLGPVVEDPVLSDGSAKHSCYMLLNGISHDEIPGLPGYTPEGDAAGNNGNVAVSSVINTSARSHVELWMTGPFHAIGILRPHLQRVGFGRCDNAATSPWRSGATLDVLRGLGARQPQAAPILWPGNGTTTNLDRFIAESPDPRSFCGWSGGGGLPVLALMPESTPTASGTITGPAGPLETCTLSAANTNGVARSILSGDNAVVVMPRNRLDPGTYTVTVSTPSRQVTWSFTIDPAAADGQPKPPTPAPTTQQLGDRVGFQPVSPARVVDTREWIGAGRLPARTPVRLQIAGQGGVPAGAAAVSLNATVVVPSAGGFLTLWNCSADIPTVSTLNYGMWETVPNGATVPLDAGGGLCAYSQADADLVLDVNGFYAASSANRFNPVTPSRVLDTREWVGGFGRLAGGQQINLPVRGLAGVAGDATAAVLNVTSVFPALDGYVTVYPCDAARPFASNLNPVIGRVRPNLVVAPIAADGTVCLFSNTDVDLVVDVTGYLSPSSAMAFQAAQPFRLVDTRDTQRPDLHQGQAGRAVAGGQVLTVQVAGARGIAASAKAISANITTVGGSGAGFVTAFPCGGIPTASSANFDGANPVANGGHLPLSAAGQLCLFASNDTHVIVDVNGWWS